MCAHLSYLTAMCRCVLKDSFALTEPKETGITTGRSGPSQQLLQVAFLAICGSMITGSLDFILLGQHYEQGTEGRSATVR